MKTNQVLTRKMGNFDVLQRTSDGMFNATELLKQWNRHSGQKKEVSKYFENPATKEFINAIVNEEFPSYAKNGDDVSMYKLVYCKSRANKGKNAGTWMHPLLFIDFAMWINPAFKVKVLKFVYDELIRYRNMAGDAYREMSAAIKKIVPSDFLAATIQNIAKALNHIVYGSHETAIRNKVAEENKMRELCELERDIAKLINYGFIKTYQELREYLAKKWRERNTPKVFLVN